MDIYRSPVPFARIHAVAVSSAKRAGRNSASAPPKLFTLDSSTAQLGAMDARLGVKVNATLSNVHRSYIGSMCIVCGE